MYWIIGAFFLGALTTILLRVPVKIIANILRNRAPLIRKYWIVVIPFLLMTATIYVVLAIYDKDDVYFEILGQVSGLMFAVFVGYIAFAEWSQSKFEGLLKSGNNEFIDRKNFKTALIDLEEAHKIKPKHTKLFANLLELYLITENYDKFDRKIEFYKSVILEDQDILKYYWLLACRYLVVEDLRTSKEKIKIGLEFTASNHHLRSKFNWQLDELKTADNYKKLSITTKRILDNYHAYLKGRLEPDIEEKFVKGNYDVH